MREEKEESQQSSIKGKENEKGVQRIDKGMVENQKEGRVEQRERRLRRG